MIREKSAETVHTNRTRRRRHDTDPAAEAARAVAAAMDRADDRLYIAYLAALGRLASRRRSDQWAGVAQMVEFASHATYGSDARANLRDYVDAADRGRRPRSALAVGIAREALKVPYGSPHPAAGSAGTHRLSRPPLLDAGRLFARAARGEPSLSGVILAGAVLFGLLSAVIAAVLDDVIDEVWVPALTLGRIDATATALTALAGLALFAGRAVGLFVHRVGVRAMRVRLQATYQRAVLDRLIGLPVTWHQRQSPRRLIATADTATKAAWRPLAPLPRAVAGLVLLLAAAVGLWLLNSWFALIGVGLLVTLIVVNVAFLRTVGPHVYLAKALRDQVFEITQQAFAAPADGRRRPPASTDALSAFTATSARLREVMVRVRRMRGAFLALLGALPPAGALVALAVSARTPGADGAGDLVSAAFLLTSLSGPVLAVGSVLSDVPRGLQGWGRIRKVLVAKDETAYGAASLPEGTPTAVRFEKVCFSPPDGPQLRAADIEVPAGRLTAVVGHSAAAVAHLATRFVDPDDGTVMVSGMDMRAVALDALVSRIAYVPPPPYQAAGSIRDFLACRPGIDDEAAWRVLRLVERHRAVAALPRGLDTVLSEELLDDLGYPLAVARALIGRPSLLVLEPAVGAAGIAPSALLAIRATGETTVLAVTRQPSVVEAADRVVYVAADGRAHAGTHRALLTAHPLYADLLRRPRPAPAGRNQSIRRTRRVRGVPVATQWSSPKHGQIEEMADVWAFTLPSGQAAMAAGPSVGGI